MTEDIRTRYGLDRFGWKPIETAPKDGKLIWLGNKKENWLHEGLWLTQEQIHSEGIHDYSCDEDLKPGWHEYQTGHPEFGIFYQVGKEPDCWMPLPSLTQPDPLIEV